MARFEAIDQGAIVRTRASIREGQVHSITFYRLPRDLWQYTAYITFGYVLVDYPDNSPAPTRPLLFNLYDDQPDSEEEDHEEEDSEEEGSEEGESELDEYDELEPDEENWDVVEGDQSFD